MGMDQRGLRHRERGQVAILFALVFTFLFILFAFVVDFGHLVNSKINLQIAADSAAYAGAAWEARQLNRMAMLNYHMRQDLKEMAMRVNVTHLRHNRNFPRGAQFYKGDPQTPTVNPFICQQAHGYVSISGIRYATDTNLCRNADPETGGLPPIVVPPVIATFDPFAVAISAQISSIQKAADAECVGAADDNRVLAEHFIRTFTRRSQFHSQQMKSLVEWMNNVSQETPQGSSHPLVKSAYQSALKNLELANQDDFKMEILQPRGGEYVRLNEYKTRASLFYINFQTQGGGGCVGRPGSLDFEDMSLGFEKVPAIVTYFAVKLTSKPKLFFMPEKWVEGGFPELTAYAAAKPFGSRLGPKATTDQLAPVPGRANNASRLVNFSMKPNDSLGIYSTKMMAYLDALHPYNGSGRPDGNQQSGWPEPNKDDNLKLPLQAIRAPSVFDAILYSVFPDPGANKDNDYLEPQFAEVLYPDYLEAADPKQNTVLQTAQPQTAPYLAQDVGSKNRGPGWIQIDATPDGGTGPYGTYSEEQPASHSTTSAVGLPEMNNPTEFGWASPEIIHSGWTPEGKKGRIGYSVKFIGMDALMRTLRVEQDGSGSQGPIANPPTGDPNLEQIYH